MRAARLVAFGLAGSVAAMSAAAQTPIADLTRTSEQRAALLVSGMTLEEKAAQVGHTAPAIPRLGVPQYNWWNEGLHGVARAGVATVFPQAIGMAASWDEKRMREVADVISTEFRAKYVERLHKDGSSDFYRGLTVWSPNINIFRDPRWGRGQETYGEDPFLTSRMGIAFIKGLQGDHPNYFKTIATSKHFAVHSGPESNRHKEDVYPSKRDLEDTYLPAFRATVIEGGVRSIMCVYNAVYGVPGCASEMLQQEYLRQNWGFQGYIVSDCGAAANIYRPDALGYTKTAPEGVAIAFKNGMDLICGDYRNNLTTDADNIVKSVKSGLLPEAVLDRSVRRLMEARIRLGMFDPAAVNPYARITAKDYDTPAHHAKSLDMAKASMVLLKNQGDLLPFKGAPRTIAVIGPNADSFDTLVGNYYGTPSKPVTVLDGIRTRFPSSKILYSQGTGLIGPAELPVPETAFCIDMECSAPGLKVETFNGVNLEGAPVKTGADRTARVNWTGDRASSMRWTGTILAPESGEYRFRFASENGYRVWIGDKPVVDEWGVGDAPSIYSNKVQLERGRRYPIRVEGFQRGARGQQQLVWSEPNDKGEEAVAMAGQADVIVFVGGLSARVEGEEMRVEAPGFAGGDRTSLDLPAPQQRLLERVQATGKPVVLVLMSGSALGVNWADANVPAIVQAWYPGGEGGHAVAQLLAGDYSPAGRLPVTFYRSAAQLPLFADYNMEGRTYRYFKGEALYPFGHGLSYTRFRYSKPRFSSAVVRADGFVDISVDVTNEGGRDGDEVVQLYVTHPQNLGAPLRTLKGFQRVHLLRGETKTLSFRLQDRGLSTVNSDGKRSIRPGRVDVWIGGGQPISRAGLPTAPGVKTSFIIEGQKLLPK
jgi:beta-glucosidase